MSRGFDRYRLYLDESGDHVFHDEKRLAEPTHRYLALVGCWFAQGEAYLSFHRALEDLKQRHFPHSPDEPVVLHRRDIIDCWGSFWRLRDERARAAFDEDLCALIGVADFRVCGVCIDKLAMSRNYPDPFHPYHLALDFLLQRYCGWLNHVNRSGDVLAESRNRAEDMAMKNAYEHIWTHGDMFHRSDFFRRTLTSKEAKLKKKSENTAGLQLADLLARGVRDDILREYGRPVERLRAFDARLLEIVQGKYNRRLYEGTVQGYGKVLFPR
jgi:hypothetical protein